MLLQTSAEAVVEKTMGMTMTVLNAVDHRTRSVSTAKRRPKKVTKKGKMTTQMTLLRNAVSRLSVVKRFL